MRAYDLLGVYTDCKPKFTKRYANLNEVAVNGLRRYAAHVRAGAFPDDDHTYGVDEAELERFVEFPDRRANAV